MVIINNNEIETDKLNSVCRSNQNNAKIEDFQGILELFNSVFSKSAESDSNMLLKDDNIHGKLLECMEINDSEDDTFEKIEYLDLLLFVQQNHIPMDKFIENYSSIFKAYSEKMPDLNNSSFINTINKDIANFNIENDNNPVSYEYLNGQFSLKNLSYVKNSDVPLKNTEIEKNNSTIENVSKGIVSHSYSNKEINTGFEQIPIKPLTIESDLLNENKSINMQLNEFIDNFESQELVNYDKFNTEKKSILLNSDSNISLKQNSLEKMENINVISKIDAENANLAEGFTDSDTSNEPGKPKNKPEYVPFKSEENTISADNIFSKGEIRTVNINQNSTNPIQKDQLLNQIVDKIDLSCKNGITNIEIRLTPEIFGGMEIETTFDGEQIKLNLISQKDEVSKILISETEKLTAMLTEKGYKVEQIKVFEKSANDMSGYGGTGYSFTNNNHGNTENPHYKLKPVHVINNEAVNENETGKIISGSELVNIYI
ncbi:MAG: flagellar hook-length control protein FliK [Clostridia bacterium]|nr:flagellar hook-length control protein FliK [Clostridia bacterium]